MPACLLAPLVVLIVPVCSYNRPFGSSGSLRSDLCYLKASRPVTYASALAAGKISSYASYMTGFRREAPVQARQAAIADQGISSMARGWYDALCRGYTNDYCR